MGLIAQFVRCALFHTLVTKWISAAVLTYFFIHGSLYMGQKLNITSAVSTKSYPHKELEPRQK